MGDAPDDATHLVATVHRLRRKPIGALTAEDLRVLVNQKEGVDVLVPRALDGLVQEPLLEGDFFPGDVLTAVLRVPASYWSAHPELLAKLDRVITSIEDPHPPGVSRPAESGSCTAVPCEGHFQRAWPCESHFQREPRRAEWGAVPYACPRSARAGRTQHE